MITCTSSSSRLPLSELILVSWEPRIRACQRMGRTSLPPFQLSCFPSSCLTRPFLHLDFKFFSHSFLIFSSLAPISWSWRIGFVDGAGGGDTRRRLLLWRRCSRRFCYCPSQLFFIIELPKNDSGGGIFVPLLDPVYALLCGVQNLDPLPVAKNNFFSSLTDLSILSFLNIWRFSLRRDSLTSRSISTK